tara:strand:+ start:3882 stop:4127 length:246 start_codon:yes stop_codon:yes gene_type:complete
MRATLSGVKNMTPHATTPSLDLSGFNYGNTDVIAVRRSAELARAEYLSAIAKKAGLRIAAFHRSAGNLFNFTQRQNQAIRL